MQILSRTNAHILASGSMAAVGGLGLGTFRNLKDRGDAEETRSGRGLFALSAIAAVGVTGLTAVPVMRAPSRRSVAASAAAAVIAFGAGTLAGGTAISDDMLKL